MSNAVPTHYLLENTASDEPTREVHTASNARDLLMHTKYRLVLKGTEAEMKRSLKDPLVIVDTDENGKPTQRGAAQIEANLRSAEHQSVVEAENASDADADADATAVTDDDDIAPMKVVS